MAHEYGIIILISIGLAAGIMSGMLGLGGGLIIVPALVYIMGLSQQTAMGTSLAILLPPVGLGAVVEYYRNGHVDIRAALIIAVALFLGAWLSSYFANKIPEVVMRLVFGVFVLILGIAIIVDTVKKLPMS